MMHSLYYINSIYLIIFCFSIMKLYAEHSIPQEIYEEATIALSHYPELANTPIEFKFKAKIRQCCTLSI